MKQLFNKNYQRIKGSKEMTKFVNYDYHKLFF